MADNRFTEYQESITNQSRQDSAVAIINDALYAYLKTRRDALIMELRTIDKVLGREQTIPERKR